MEWIIGIPGAISALILIRDRLISAKGVDSEIVLEMNTKLSALKESILTFSEDFMELSAWKLMHDTAQKLRATTSGLYLIIKLSGDDAKKLQAFCQSEEIKKSANFKPPGVSVIEFINSQINFTEKQDAYSDLKYPTSKNEHLLTITRNKMKPPLEKNDQRKYKNKNEFWDKVLFNIWESIKKSIEDELSINYKNLYHGINVIEKYLFNLLNFSNQTIVDTIELKDRQLSDFKTNLNNININYEH